MFGRSRTSAKTSAAPEKEAPGAAFPLSGETPTPAEMNALLARREAVLREAGYRPPDGTHQAWWKPDGPPESPSAGIPAGKPPKLGRGGRLPDRQRGQKRRTARPTPRRKRRLLLLLIPAAILLLLFRPRGAEPSVSKDPPAIRTELDFPVEDGAEPIEVETYLENDWYLYLYDSEYLDMWLDYGSVTPEQLKARVRANPDITPRFQDFLCLFIDRLAEKQPQAELRPFYENLKTLKVVECTERELMMASLSPDSSGCYVSTENCIYVLKDKEYPEGTWDFQVMFHELCHAMRTYRRNEEDPRLGKTVTYTAGLRHSEVIPDEMFNSLFAVSLFDYDEWDIAYQLQSNYLALIFQSTDTITPTDYMNHSQSWLYRKLDEANGDVNYAETVFRLIDAQYQDYHSDRIDYPPETFCPLYDYVAGMYLRAHLTPGMTAEEARAVMDAMLERLLFDVPEDYRIPTEHFYQYLENYLAENP